MADAIKILQSVFGPRDFVPDIQVDGGKCAARRHNRVQCRLCVSVCPSGALSCSDGEVEVDHESCTHCGACITACPTQALESAWLSWTDLVSGALRAVKASGGEPVISCAKRAGDEAFSPRGMLSVPCLERIDEALVLSMVAGGARRVTFLPGDCRACGGHCDPVIWPNVIKDAQDMLATVGCEVEMAIDRPAAPSCDSQEPVLSRRDMLSSIGEGASRFAGDVVEAYASESRSGEVARMLGLLDDDSRLGSASRGQVCSWALGALALQKAGDARSALDMFGENALQTRVYAKPVVDPSSCTRCLLCVAYCREHAVEKLRDGTGVKGLEIKPHLCNGCGTCVDVCRPGSMSLLHHMRLADILQERATGIVFEDGGGSE